jgi:hypothetical protein
MTLELLRILYMGMRRRRRRRRRRRVIIVTGEQKYT